MIKKNNIKIIKTYIKTLKLVFNNTYMDIEKELVEYNKLIDFYKDNLERAEYYFDQIKKHCIYPYIITYSSIINVCKYNHNMKKVDYYFELMKNNNIEPNIITYNILLDICIDVENYERGNQIYVMISEELINSISNKVCIRR